MGPIPGLVPGLLSAPVVRAVGIAFAAAAFAAMRVAAVVVSGCTASPTVTHLAGKTGLSSFDAGAQRCPVAPTPAGRGPSAGCGKATTQATGKYVRFTLTVDCEAEDARDRLYYVRLPRQLRSGQAVSHRLPRSRGAVRRRTWWARARSTRWSPRPTPTRS